MNGPYRTSTAGFTLIELLVVVAIISMLSSLVLSTISTSRLQAIDAVKLNIVHDYDIAIQSYYFDKGVYPMGQMDSVSGIDLSSLPPFMPELITGGYIPNLPVWPGSTNLYWIGAYDDNYGSFNYLSRTSYCGLSKQDLQKAHLCLLLRPL